MAQRGQRGVFDDGERREQRVVGRLEETGTLDLEIATAADA